MSPDGEKLGISLLPCVKGSNNILPISDVKDIAYGFNVLNEDELAAFNRPKWRYAVTLFQY